MKFIGDENPVEIYFCLIMLLLFAAILIWVSGNYVKYITCSHCDKEIKLFVKWTCDFCDTTQDKERMINAKCCECGRKLKVIYCEHCHGEHKL